MATCSPLTNRKRRSGRRAPMIMSGGRRLSNVSLELEGPARAALNACPSASRQGVRGALDTPSPRPSSASGIDASQAPRTSFRGGVSSAEPGSWRAAVRGEDLSPGGAFIKSDLLLEPGDGLALEFRVPGVPRLMRAQARVAWVRRFPQDGRAAGMGVEFLTMTDEDRAASSRRHRRRGRGPLAEEALLPRVLLLAHLDEANLLVGLEVLGVERAPRPGSASRRGPCRPRRGR